MGKSKLILIAAIMVIAVAGVSQAEMGVGVRWEGSSIQPVLTLPILMSPGMIIEPMLGFTSVSQDDGESSSAASATSLAFEGTQFMFGARLEKSMNEEGPTGLFGGHAKVAITSPDSDVLDSYMDLTIGAFVGGSAPVGDNFDFVGTMGLQLTLNGEQTATSGGTEVVTSPSVTTIGTFANFSMRWWVFGN